MIGYDGDVTAQARSKRGKAAQICIVFDPKGAFITLWRLLNFGLLFYNATATPFRVAFHTTPTSTALFVFETLTDFIFLLDIVITFLLPYERIDSSFETNHKKIARKYIRTTLWLDAAVVFPTQFFERPIPSTLSFFDQDRLKHRQQMFRLVRLLKIFKIAKFYPTVSKLVSLVDVKTSIMRIGLICVGSIFLVHIFACIFYFCSKMFDFESNTWVYNKDMVDAGKQKSYSYSVYWAFQTLTTVGYGDFGAYNSWELTFTCFWMFLGVAFYSFVVGSMTSIITQFGNEDEALQLKERAFEKFAAETGLEE